MADVGFACVSEQFIIMFEADSLMHSRRCQLQVWDELVNNDGLLCVVCQLLTISASEPLAATT